MHVQDAPAWVVWDGDWPGYTVTVKDMIPTYRSVADRVPLLVSAPGILMLDSRVALNFCATPSMTLKGTDVFGIFAGDSLGWSLNGASDPQNPCARCDSQSGRPPSAGRRAFKP